MPKTTRPAGPRARRTGRGAERGPGHGRSVVAVIVLAALSACATQPGNADELDDLFTALPAVVGTTIDCDIKEFLGDISDCELIIVVEPSASEDELQTVVATAQDSFDELVVRAKVVLADSVDSRRSRPCLQVTETTAEGDVPTFLAMLALDHVSSVCSEGHRLTVSTDEGTDMAALTATTQAIMSISGHDNVIVSTGSREITAVDQQLPTTSLALLAAVDESMLSRAGVTKTHLYLTISDSVTVEDLEAHVAALPENDGSIKVVAMRPPPPKE